MPDDRAPQTVAAANGIARLESGAGGVVVSSGMVAVDLVSIWYCRDFGPMI
jgi:cystathionine beta-lyase/cystathionine gamma-synthase